MFLVLPRMGYRQFASTAVGGDAPVEFAASALAVLLHGHRVQRDIVRVV